MANHPLHRGPGLPHCLPPRTTCRDLDNSYQRCGNGNHATYENAETFYDTPCHQWYMTTLTNHISYIYIYMCVTCIYDIYVMYIYIYILYIHIHTHVCLVAPWWLFPIVKKRRTAGDIDSPSKVLEEETRLAIHGKVGGEELALLRSHGRWAWYPVETCRKIARKTIGKWWFSMVI